MTAQEIIQQQIDELNQQIAREQAAIADAQNRLLDKVNKRDLLQDTLDNL